MSPPFPLSQVAYKPDCDRTVQSTKLCTVIHAVIPEGVPLEMCALSPSARPTSLAAKNVICANIFYNITLMIAVPSTLAKSSAAVWHLHLLEQTSETNLHAMHLFRVTTSSARNSETTNSLAFLS